MQLTIEAKWGRTCYMCVSPTHFIRDCPMASNEQHMYHTRDRMFQGSVSGYPMPYWNTPAFHSVNPYMNMYGNPICNTYFKNVVMIPCCQHSFCEKCICDVLPLKSRCPKCSSTKYSVEHLLPNLSLRHAIEHFLESQILASAPENDLQKYVPDGESGIQGKEVSTKRKLDMLCSTSATEKGPNQNMAESAYESLNKKNVFLDGAGYHTVCEFCPNVELCRLTEQVVFLDPYKISAFNCWTSPYFDNNAGEVRNDRNIET